MKGWAKKIGLVLGIIASCLVIGQSINGWVNNDTETEPAGSETAVVAVVE